jgi:hypothetical protein
MPNRKETIKQVYLVIEGYSTESLEKEINGLNDDGYNYRAHGSLQIVPNGPDESRYSSHTFYQVLVGEKVYKEPQPLSSKNSTKKVLGKSGYGNIISLVEAYMLEHGFDGLYSNHSCDINCSCSLGNHLMHRGDCLEGLCSFGYFIPEEHEDFIKGYNWMIGPVDYKLTKGE